MMDSYKSGCNQTTTRSVTQGKNIINSKDIQVNNVEL